MNAIRQINEINQKELATNTSDLASWHADYKDTSYIYIGYIPIELNEIDICKIFSQYGNPTHINLVKDKETGKSRGFAYLKYENYKSCILAIDNFNGIKIFDKTLKIDHVYYELRQGQEEDDFKIDYSKAFEDLSKDERDKKKIQGNGSNKLLEYKKEEEGIDTDEFADPMANYTKEKAEEDDEFADPMASHIKRKRGSEDKDHHRSKHRDSHRSKHSDKDRRKRHHHHHHHSDKHEK